MAYKLHTDYAMVLYINDYNIMAYNPKLGNIEIEPANDNANDEFHASLRGDIIEFKTKYIPKQKQPKNPDAMVIIKRSGYNKHTFVKNISLEEQKEKFAAKRLELLRDQRIKG